MSERSAGRSALPSDRLPATDFDSDRFTAENLSFWIPLLVELGAMTRNSRVLDVGCGTGGFAIAIAEKTGAEVVGCDLSSSFLYYARRKSAGACTVEWVVGNAERLPLDAASFDCVRMSLVLHQVANKARAVAD